MERGQDGLPATARLEVTAPAATAAILSTISEAAVTSGGGSVTAAVGAVAGPPAPSPTLPVPPPPEDPAFLARGSLLLPAPLAPAGMGVTEKSFRLACSAPVTQGLDGWVFEVPARFLTGPVAADVMARGGLGTHDLDVVLYSATCDKLGPLDTGGAHQHGILPPGTRFIVVSDRTGAGTQLELALRHRRTGPGSDS